VLAAMTTMPAGAAAAAPTPFKVNLVKNPGAEAGNASPSGNTAVTIPNWDTTGNFTVVKYGTAGGFPSLRQGRRINGKHQFFASGVQASDGTCGTASQRISIVGHNDAIDAGQISVTVIAHMATYGRTQPEVAEIELIFRGGPKSMTTTVPDLLTAVHTNDVFQHWGYSLTLPEGTRSVEIKLMNESDHGGTYCDDYFDAISLKLCNGPGTGGDATCQGGPRKD